MGVVPVGSISMLSEATCVALSIEPEASVDETIRLTI